MARMTKAQRLAREATFAEEQRAEEMASYPTRLMDLMERAMQFNFEMTVKSKQFVLVDRDSDRRPQYFLSYSFDEDSNDMLDSLRYDVERKESLRAEHLRRQMARETALSKLTEEERELLGL